MENNEEKKLPPNKATNKVVQTYAEDMARIIESGQGGVIKKIIHGEEEQEAQRKNLSPQSKKNKFFMLLGIFFILVATMALSFLFFNKNVDTMPVEKQFAPIIFNDKSTLIEVAGLKKDEIAGKVLNEVKATSVKLGGVEGIYLTFNKAPIGLRKFIEIVGANFSPGSTNLVDDNFLMGVVKDENSAFFMLLKVRSIPDVFNSMHAWESKMFSDLHGFFGIAITPETKYLLTANFEDGIVENKNARILYKKEEEGKREIAMMYILADDNSVIITNSENATHEIMLRLASSQLKK